MKIVKPNAARTMKRNVLWGLFLVMASVPVAAAPAKDLAGPDIFKTVLHEVRGMRGNYLGPGWYVIDQLIEGMNSPHPTVTLPNGNFLVWGCRMHSCDEKSAVIVTPEPKMLAAGLINFHCRPDHSVPHARSIHIPATSDIDHPILTIFVKKKTTSPN